jgi:ribosomal protein L3 glutamine methyltransferase
VIEHRAAAVQELCTANDWIRFTATQCANHQLAFGQGTDNALDDARWLVTGALGLPPETPETLLQCRILPNEREVLWQLLYRRVIERQPTAYLLGEAWLCGYRFRADPRALIPRSYIAEFLSTQGFPGCSPSEAPLRILELCTGSASLTILAAHAWPQAQLVATDLSGDALALATDNLSDYGLNDRVTLYQGDLFDALPQTLLANDGPFDLILCNPPYVNQESMRRLPAEFCQEPSLALAGGYDGMTLVAKILAGYRQWLSPEGLLVVEIGHEAAACEQLFAKNFPTLMPVWLDTAETSQRVFLLGAIT